MTQTSTTSATAQPEMVHVPLDQLLALARSVLLRLGLSEAHAGAMARVIVAGQRDACQSHGVYRLTSCAHTVRTGKVRLFHTAELSEAALLASACLPTLHHAVEIDGEHYWDGGFTANPAIYPLLYECTAPDILMVLLNPLQRDDAPRSAEDISARSMELGFSTTFLREMRMIAHARQYIAETAGWMPLGRLERKLVGQRFHLIEARELAEAGSASKLNAASGFLTELHTLGRSRADEWLRKQYRHVGRKETVDVARLFL